MTARRSSRARRAAVVAMLLAMTAAGGRVGAQETPPVPVPARDTMTLLQRLNLDRLGLTALGASIGAVRPTQVAATQSYAIHADYGHIARDWRVVFTATYWGSNLSRDALRTFADTLRKSIVDPTGDYSLDLGRVRISDIALGTELRWMALRPARGWLRPYLGGGIAAHVVNAEGRAISGTFVERALDNITAGVLGTAGLDAVVFQHVSLGMQARYDLLSGTRFGSLRLVGSYIFTPVRRPGIPARGPQ